MDSSKINKQLNYFLSLFMAVIIVVTSLSYGLWTSYQTAVSQAELNTRNLATTLAAHFQQVLARTHAVLEVQANDFPLELLQTSAIAKHQQRVVEKMTRLIGEFPDISGTYFFDASGDMLYSSDPDAKSSNVADRPFFKRLQNDPSLKFSFSDALIARTTGRWSIVIAHAIRDASSQFLGVTTALLDLSLEEAQLKSIQIGSLGTISIRRSDNTNLLLRIPFVVDKINQPFPPDNPIRALLLSDQDTGTIFEHSPFDGIDRIVSIKKIQNYPFYVQVGMAKADYLRHWYMQAYTTLLIGGLFLLITILATAFHFRVERREAQAIDRIRRSEARYNTLFSNSKAPMLLVDPTNGLIVEANRAAYEFYGFGDGRLESMSINEINVLSPEEITQEMDHAVQENRSHFIFKHRLGTGEIRDVEVHSGPIEVEGQILLYSIVHDITERKRAEQTIAAQNLRYQTLLKSSTDGVHIIDLEGNVVDANEAFCRQLGYTLEEVLRLNVQEWDSQWSGDELLLVLRQLIESKQGHQFVTKHRRKDGTLLDVEVNAVQVVLEGKPLLFASARNITERKKLDATILANEQKLRGMYELSPLGLALVDMTGHFIEFNEAFRKITGYSTDELVRLDYWDLTPKQYEASEAVQIHSLVDSGRYGPYEKEYIRKDGTLVPVQLNGMIVKGADGKDYIWSIVEDITERKQNELATLEAKTQAENLARTKSEFLANMSHEIRTPMNAIMGLSQLALDKELSAQVRDYLEKINASSESLLEILNDILDFSKMEAGKLAIEHSAFRLVQVLGNLHSLFAAKAEEKHLNFTIEAAADIPTRLIGDALRLQQILANLLGNAIKFTRQGSVDLKLQLLESMQSQIKLRFSVSDTGIGISEHDQAKLFQPFSQVDTSITRRFGGTGLGLAISHNLLSMMGSDLHVDSVLGQGTTFSFELLLGVTNADSLSIATRSQGQLKADALSTRMRESAHAIVGSKILLAEDNPGNQQVVTGFLDLAGVTVDIANNGIETLRLLGDHHYDAILMDVHMPEMGGVEATEQIRRKEQYAQLPIIALSAGVTSEEREQCLACGMNDFVAKPVNPDELIRVLLHWIPQ